MSRLKTGLKVSAWVAVFIIAVVYLQRYGIAPLQSAMNDMGIWAPLGLFLLRGVSIILPALPSSVYSLLAGSLLGFKAGYLTIILSDLVFCSAAFFIARCWGRRPVSRLVGASAMKRIDDFSKNQLEGNFFLMTGLLMTGLFDFLSYAIGISHTHWRLFAPALLISVLISDSILVAVGAGAAQGASLTLGLALLAMFALATITGVLKKKSSEVPSDNHS
ncbi:TVP38/TMEM64 family protein [Parasynechococcus sp.]|uniref:TVP38/TMEM64 family protein n=1 Tax=Parasynechococcus sp. TaxID=3101203 RepID=UPI00370397A2